jgi:ferric-dicitrate binding protein FerR (iron transport regulator)
MKNKDVSQSDIIRSLSRALECSNMALDSLRKHTETQDKTLDQMKTLNNQLQEMNTNLMSQCQELRKELAEQRSVNEKRFQSATTQEVTSAVTSGFGNTDDTSTTNVTLEAGQQLVQLEDGNFVLLNSETAKETEKDECTEKKRGLSSRAALSKKAGDGELITMETHQKILKAVSLVST